MIHKLRPLIVIAVIAGIVGGGYWYFTQNPEKLVELKLNLGLIDVAEATGVYAVSGYIETEEVTVASETKGRIVLLDVDEGDFIEAGQPIIVLDTALIDTQIQQAHAKITTARAQLAKVKAGVRAEEIAKVKAAVAVAEANAEAAHTQWQDTLMLRDNPQELDMQIDAAKTALELAELNINASIPAKNAGETMYTLDQTQWEDVQENKRKCITKPGFKTCFTIKFPEGVKQDAGVAWNMAGTELWDAWATLNSSFVERDDAETQLNDLLRLRNDPQAAQVRVTQAEAARQTALAQVSVAVAQLDAIEAGPRAEQIAVAKAQVEQAEANLAALNVQREKSLLVSPVAGWVVDRVANEGEMSIPGTSLLTLADLTDVTLTVYVPEPDISLVSVGQPIKVYVDSFPGEPFAGQVTFISDKAEFTPKNVQTKEERVNTVFAVKIKLENKDQRLKPGMPADAVLSEGTQL